MSAVTGLVPRQGLGFQPEEKAMNPSHPAKEKVEQKD